MVPSPNASAGRDLLVGIDAGTSVIKAVAFDLAGRQIAVASVPNRYTTNADGAALSPQGLLLRPLFHPARLAISEVIRRFVQN